MKVERRACVVLTAVLTTAALCLGAGVARAEEDEGLGLSVGLDNVLLQFSQEGGVADSGGQSVDLDAEYAPRLEVGFAFRKGLGIRARYWEFDADGPSTDDGSLEIDTHYLDIEMFQRMEVTRNTEVEFSLGLRETEFRQLATETAFPSSFEGAFDGWGGTGALEGKRELGMGKLYANGRFSLLVGDHDLVSAFGGPPVTFTAEDSLAHQVELAFGYEFNLSLADSIALDVSVGLEWQQWSNMAPADSVFGGVGNDDVLEDVGFHGFVVGAEIRF